MFEPNQKRRELIVAIIDFMRAQPDGARITWVEIEQATGAPMRTNEQRALVREACAKLDRAYIAIPGSGIELSSATNAAEIGNRETRKIGNAIERASTTVSAVISRHGNELSSEVQRGLLRVAGLAGALRTLRDAGEKALTR